MSESTERSTEPGTARLGWPAGLSALAVALLVYAPSLGGGFISDDVLYLEHNELLRLPFATALPRIVGEPFFANWSPLHVIFLFAEWRLFGDDALGYRIANIALQAGVALSVAAAARRGGLSPRAAFLAGAIFLVHPVAAEPVAWINQSKTLLALAFSLLALERWLAHLGAPSARRVGAALALGVCALLSKPAALPLPAVFAVAVGTHGGGRWRELRWVVPFALAAAATLVMNLHAQAQGGGVSAWFGGSPEATARILPWVVWRYLRLSVLPMGLVFGVHPDPITGWLDARVIGPAAACAALAALLAYAVRGAPRRGLALAWFGLSLLPVLQIVPTQLVYADRYLYFALPGAAVLIADGLDRALDRSQGRRRWAVSAAVALALVGLALTTAGQARLWADPEALYTRTTRVYPLGRTGWTGLGAARQRRDDPDGAAAAYLRSLEVHPQDGQVRHLLARVRLLQKRRGRALYDLEESLRITPRHHDADWMRKTVERLRRAGVEPVPDPE